MQHAPPPHEVGECQAYTQRNGPLWIVVLVRHPDGTQFHSGDAFTAHLDIALTIQQGDHTRLINQPLQLGPVQIHGEGQIIESDVVSCYAFI